MHEMTEQLGDSARGLLSFVFTEARETLERSPEQVGRTLGMSGRTVRRLEDPEDEQRPRRATLHALAEFYGLDAGFMTTLASVEWENYEGAELAQRLAPVGRRGPRTRGHRTGARAGAAPGARLGRAGRPLGAMALAPRSARR